MADDAPACRSPQGWKRWQGIFADLEDPAWRFDGPENQGSCDNRMNIRRDALGASTLNDLCKPLVSPDLFQECWAECPREVSWRRMERGADLAGGQRELDMGARELAKRVEAILQGSPHPLPSSRTRPRNGKRTRRS